jgi:hypothetical protein
MDGTIDNDFPALSALLDPDNTERPNLQAVETEALRGRYGELAHEIGQYTDATKAASTYRAYNAGLRRQKRFAKAIRGRAFPSTPEFLAKYIAYLADHEYAHSTIICDLAAAQAVARALNDGVDSGREFLVKQVLRGIGRVNGIDAKHPKRAWQPDHTRAVLPHYEEISLTNPVKAARDLSILTLGNAAAMRRQSFTALRTENLEFYAQGLVLTLHGTKTRQDAGDAHRIEINRIRDERVCPVIALLRYIEVARLESGFVYRRVYSNGRVGDGPLTGEAICRIVQNAAGLIGLPAKEFGAHSLRAGMITAGVEAGAATEDLMGVSDHRDIRTFLKYVRPERLFSRDTTGRVFE